MLTVYKKLIQISEEEEVPGYSVKQWEERGIYHGFLGRVVDFAVGQESRREKYPQLILVKQVHGDDILDLTSEKADQVAEIEADAIIADTKNIEGYSIGVITADCAPVLITAQENLLIAAVHCGWRGIEKKLLIKVLDRFVSYGARMAQIEIAIGACARECCYEVGREVSELFGESGERQNKVYHLDLAKLIIEQAIDWGIIAANLAVVPECTICVCSNFSYRREKEQSGRQLSFISASLNF